jgi:hypothetical protein
MENIIIDQTSKQSDQHSDQSYFYTQLQAMWQLYAMNWVDLLTIDLCLL